MSEPKDFIGSFLAIGSIGFWAWAEMKQQCLVDEVRKNLRCPLVRDDSLDGKPVFVSGILNRDGILLDSEFNKKKECLRLQRKVEKYDEDWKEEEDKDFIIKNSDLIAKGPYNLTQFQVSEQIVNSLQTKWTLPVEMIPRSFSEAMKKKGYAIYHDSKHYFISKFTRKSGNYKPVNGDLRVSHIYTPNNMSVSVLGMQQDGFIIPYKDKVFFVKEGLQDKEDLIEMIPKEPKNFLYTARICGILGTAIGLFYQIKAFKKSSKQKT
ncbi:hypothetical protein SteCoe_28298 [Stentor coeruleus]|uniref:Uncharacterized protein n=1 Tax=Stentor coeruleus TaxID=5963 RepID=A0A1R2B8L2_9CILI|nr:hypothetical protein SteCoe_28298 [Stentor coeruleus]